MCCHSMDKILELKSNKKSTRLCCHIKPRQGQVFRVASGICVNVTVKRKTFAISNHAASQSGPVKNRYSVFWSCVLPMSVWSKQMLSNIWISFAMCLQLNLLDINRFHGSDIHIKPGSVHLWLMCYPSWISFQAC